VHSNRLSDISIKDVVVFRHAQYCPCLTRLPLESFIVPAVGSQLRFALGGMDIYPDFYCSVCLQTFIGLILHPRVLHVVLYLGRSWSEWGVGLTRFFFFSRHCNRCGFCPAQLSLSILSRKVFAECRCQRHVKRPTWRTSD